MSVIHRGDEPLHYSDGSHRWCAPAGMDQERWDAVIRAHQADHRTQLGETPPRWSPRDHPRVSRSLIRQRAAATGRTVA